MIKSKNLSPHAVTTSAASAKGTTFFRDTASHTNPSATKSATRRSQEVTAAIMRLPDTQQFLNLAPSLTPTSNTVKNNVQ